MLRTDPYASLPPFTDTRRVFLRCVGVSAIVLGVSAILALVLQLSGLRTSDAAWSQVGVYAVCAVFGTALLTGGSALARRIARRERKAADHTEPHA